jgi:hypothetical protein
VTGVLAAGALAMAGAAVTLVVICWRARAVLPGFAAAVGIALVAFAIASGLRGRAARDALLISLIFVLLGSVLYGLGQTFERLLEGQPEDPA